MSELEDNALVKATAEGDQEAFTTLYNRYATRLFSFLLSRSPRADAEGISQETWVRVYRALKEDRFSPTGSFPAYLFAVARNLVTDRHRRKSALQFTEADAAQAYAESEGLAQVDVAENIEKLERLIENLPDAQRDIIRLRYAGVSFDEISEQLSLSRLAVFKQWHAAKETLRKLIAGETTLRPARRLKREISVLVDPGDAPAALIADLYATLSALYQACGGSGLTISKDERRAFIGEVMR